MTKEQELSIAQEKGELIKKALKIIHELAENSIADIDLEHMSEDNIILQDLVIESRGLKSSRWWDDLIK